MKRLSFLVLVLATALVTLGGVVHNTGSSLACPDWPLCFGKVFPKMEGAVAIEHSHRLLASLVGILTFTLLFISYRPKVRSDINLYLRKVAWMAAGLVVFQGVLGGITVLLKLSPIISTLHLATSQIFTATILIYFLELNSLEANQSLVPIPLALRRNLIFLASAVFFQMILGAFVRHSGAGVACGFGSQSALLCQDAINENFTFWPTLAPARLQIFHRALAVILLVAIPMGTIRVSKYLKSLQGEYKSYRLLLAATHAVVLAQVILGFLTLASGLNAAITTLHLVFGMTLWLLFVSLLKLSSPEAEVSTTISENAT